jgi:sugar phosphate permease
MSSSPALPARRRHELSDAATKKVFKRLIPFLLLMYVIAFLDRSNVSFAQKEFEVDFGISAAAYAFGAGLFFVGYAIFEVPSNLLLHRVGARWWLARIMVSWGIVSAAFMFVQGPISFYVLRFLLGVMEAGFFPRRHPVPHLLGSRAAPQPGSWLFLYGHRTGRHSW